jgi:hypothetical protein
MDTGAAQPIINERIAGLFESERRDLSKLETLVGTITSDHERRVRALELKLTYGLGGFAAISATVGLTLTLIKLFFTK